MSNNNKIQSLKDLKNRLIQIKNMGWIESHREHDTGIGKTFEDLLGIEENNLQIPDFGWIEVKSSREYTSSLVTLITFEPPNEFRNVEWTLDGLINAFGKTGNDGDTGLPVFHITVSSRGYTRNPQKFKLDVRTINGEEMVCVVTKRQFIPKNPNLPRDVVVCFPVKDIIQKISQKLGGCLLVIEAETRKKDNIEEFRLKNAKLYIGFSVSRFIELVREGKIYLDIRFGRYRKGPNRGKPHNHGTGWRISKKDILELYSREIDLLNDKIPEDINCKVTKIDYSKRGQIVPLTKFLKEK